MVASSSTSLHPSAIHSNNRSVSANTSYNMPHRSRTTMACAVCRNKRQKCTGEKPTCEQCRNNNEQCWWSEAKKRGPAKDYLRSLQDRLQETERLLLGLLNQVSDQDLHHVLQPGSSCTAGTPSHQRWVATMSGQEYWSGYPFNSISSIRSWQQFRVRGDELPEPGNSMGSGRAADPIQQYQQRPSSFQVSPPGHILQSLNPSSSEDIVDPAPTRPNNSSINEAPQRTEMNWQRSELNQSMPNARRYSAETRNVAETLFSISNHGDVASRPPLQAPDGTTQSQDTGRAITLSNLGTLPSQFPKHLFW